MTVAFSPLLRVLGALPEFVVRVIVFVVVITSYENE